MMYVDPLNVEVQHYLQHHDKCPYRDRAVRAIKIADGSGIVVGADVVSKNYFHTSRAKTVRCTVGKRMVYLHPVMGVIVRFIAQQDLNDPKPTQYHAHNFILDKNAST